VFSLSATFCPDDFLNQGTTNVFCYTICRLGAFGRQQCSSAITAQLNTFYRINFGIGVPESRDPLSFVFFQLPDLVRIDQKYQVVRPMSTNFFPTSQKISLYGGTRSRIQATANRSRDIGEPASDSQPLSVRGLVMHNFNFNQ
jgi:hypothetical protein